MSQGNMPDFLIIGAAKSGTTSLYFYLQQHPDIFMPSNKEPFFFTFVDQDMSKFHYEGRMNAKKNTVTTLKDYQHLFANAPVNAVKGEASTLYLYDRETPARIKAHLPEVKLIAILRNPIDRAYSHFQHFRRDRLEPLTSFREAILAEQKRMRENWFMSYYYKDAGFYAHQLENYLAHFPASQLKIFLYEDLKNTESLVREIFRFIGVNENVPLSTNAVFNRSGQVKAQWLYQKVKNSSQIKPFIRSLFPVKYWNWMKNRWDRLMIRDYEPISQDDRLFLSNIYHDDILRLQNLVNRDLAHWIAPKEVG